MPKRPEHCGFVAPPLRLNTPDDPRRPAGDRFEQNLMGFCVSGQLDQYPMPRSWWADRLRVSRSHVTKMVVEPSVPFLEQLDFLLSDVGSSQRLRPRLSEFYADIRPDSRTINARPVLEWLARNPEELTSGSVSDYLLRSEVALMRCRLRDRSDIYNDPIVTRTVDELLRLASGPYGGSNVAHQRCAELGLLVPETFFEAITRHFNSSPVGFRLLRTLCRFIRILRGREVDATTSRSGSTSTDQRLANLLRRLGRASSNARYLDPYPGAEWDITLARDCLRSGRESRLARAWLMAAARNCEGSDRERLYASWVSVSDGHEHHDTPRILATMSSSGSDVLRRWSQHFEVLDELRSVSEEDRADRIFSSFRDETDAVSDAVSRNCQNNELAGVQKALMSVIIAALITPDGRYRRSLIEGVVAAGLVSPTTDVLVDIFRGEKISSPGIRESIVFFLSRLRQPTAEVIDVLSTATEQEPQVAHAALWGMGDIFRNSVPEHQQITKLLADVAATRDQRFGARHRVAATHALAVIARTLPEDTAVEEALVRVRDAPQNGFGLPGRIVVAMATWGLRMHDRKDEIVDTTKLGVDRLLVSRR